jgi:tRNA (guanine37-N1)-methyltransferase
MVKIPSSYDIVGSKEKAVAIVEIPDDLQKKEKEIANQILLRHKNVKSVLKKISERKGKFRINEYKLLSGDENTEVIHKENYCQFKLDPRLVYFSPREGTERLRIANQVKPKETVMLMFSGVGPYSIIIAKKQPKVDKIISVEINPIAFEYMKENIRLNKVSEKIIPILGDVKLKCKDWYGKCDRVIMPLPQDAWKFLDLAFKCLKPHGIIHIYTIEKEENVKEKIKSIIDRFSKKIKRKIYYKIKKVLSYAPRTYKYCVDLKLS